MTALAVANREEIIRRIASGEYVVDIAQSMGITRPAISKQLKDDDEYRLALEAGIEARLEQRVAELQQASDQVSVARARELLSHERWTAEKRHRMYRQQPTVAVQINNGASMSDADLERIARRKVDE